MMRKRIILTERSTLPNGTREKMTVTIRKRVTAASPKKLSATKIATMYAIISTILARGSMRWTKDFCG